MYVVAPHFEFAYPVAHALFAYSPLSVLWGRYVHRTEESVRSAESVPAERSFLAMLASSQMRKCAPAATSDTLEGSLGCTKIQPAPQLLLDLPLLLLLVLLPYRRPSCCCRQQEVPTPPATHAPPLLLSMLKQQRALLGSPLEMRPWEVQKCQLIRRCSIHRPRC